MPNAVLFDILNTVAASIAARGLSGLSSTNTIVQKRPTNRAADLPATQYPCVIVAPFGAENMPGDAGLNTLDDVEYPVLVGIIFADDRSQTTSFNTALTWRESIRKLFHNQPLWNGGTNLGWRVTVRPLSILDYKAWDVKGLFASGLVLNVMSQEPRG